ncbi:pentatricopeptide repeat-containing protein At5g67570, chloroplastic isoform X2 [Magnolia sinica]|uniref:pentatricopeptide repeat-containing protein At5g67570, chloroplastic isoform X2 n=1 Tax=Magnolia sinica TaxID=86752 RepID=UPI0026593D34|nr:pentatricopeptide repeat-containing protein At5g67570, chloroplastic isoform X2 [Magnolia sinica]
MEASIRPHTHPILSSQNPLSSHPNTQKIKRRLLQKGVFPTPKIIHTVRKKETLKSIRRSKRLVSGQAPLSESQKRTLEEESYFQTISKEYRTVRKALGSRQRDGVPTVGMPWEGVKGVELREIASGNGEYGGDKVRREGLVELREMIRERKWEDLRWVLEVDGGDLEEGGLQGEVERGEGFRARKGGRDDDDAIRLLVERFVYTKLLAVLGKARRPGEALCIFNTMRGDRQIYPDMPAYHSIAVTLGQAGLVKELVGIIECMKQKPSKKIKNMCRKNWDPCLEPDLVVFNAVLNACVPCKQWKGVSWVLEQMRHSGLKPNGATYGLAMEVMLRSGKYDLVHKFFGKMRRSGLALKAITYKVLVRAFWEEGKVNEAVEAVRDMEQRGVVGTASVYYELACCLCYHGRWQEAIVQVEKLKSVPHTKPLEVAFTGMIQSCMDGGHVNDCISIFEHMKDHCTPNIGTINAMLKVYSHNDMFTKAKELFEETKKANSGCMTYPCVGTSLTPDAYSYSSMLEASARAHQWEFFEHVYKEMALCGYQIDQNKHAWVLVDASKAGKWHLLEHAFDAILEAGEIPHRSLFIEMICQNIAQHNYERAVTLINGMAHTSLQVSEKQWTDIFNRSRDRIGEDDLQNLLSFIRGSDTMTEAIACNLLTSLEYLCRSRSLKDYETTSGKMLHLLTDAVDGNHISNGNLSDEDHDLEPSPFLVYHTNDSDDDDDSDGDDLGSDPVTHASNESQTSSLSVESGIPAGYVDDSNSEPIHHGQLQNDINNTTVDLLTSRSNELDSSELPSASEILETWREKRRKDDVFLLEL